MKKYATTIILAASLGLASAASAEDEKKDRPASGGDAAAKGDEERPRPDRRPGGGERGEERRRPDGPGESGGQRPGGGLDMLRSADTDGDKKISKSEWEAASLKRANEMFARLDGDKDGFISQEDIQKMRERFGADRPGGRPEGDRPPGDRPQRGPEGRGPRDGGDDAAGGPDRPKRPDAE